MSAPTLAAPAVDDEEAARARVDQALRDVFLAEDATRRRPPHRLSMSGLGGCTRQGAYALAGTPMSDEPPPDEARAANLGTWIDSILVPLLADRLGGVHHQLVELHAAGLEIPGELDIHADRGVLDLKTVTEQRLQGMRRVGAYPNHRMQGLGYTLAVLQRQIRDGVPPADRVRRVAWLYLDRARGDHEIVTEPFTNAAAGAVVDRVAELRQAAEEPDEARRDGYGPGLSRACDGCWWLTRCWGEDARPGVVGAQDALTRGRDGTVDPAAVGDLIARLDEASRRRAAATHDYDFYRAAVDRVSRGRYGPWSLGWGKAYDQVDAAAAADRLSALGEPVPLRRVPGKIRVGLTESLSKRQLSTWAADLDDGGGAVE